MPNKLAILGLFIISYLLYRRLFKIRLPQEIIPIQDLVIISIHILLCLSTFGMACISFYIYMKIVLNKEDTRPRTNPIIVKIIEIYQNKWNPLPLFQNSLMELDIYLKNKIPMYDKQRDYLDVVIMYISTFFIKHEKLFLFIFLSIPVLFQSIVLVSFMTDVLVYTKFYYFYNNLWLLIFPLLSKYILYSIKVFLDTNLRSLENVLILKVVKASDYELYQEKAPTFNISIQDWRDLSTNTPINTYLCINALSPEYTKDNPQLDYTETLKYCIESMEQFFIIYSFIDQITLLTKKFILPFDILKYSLYSFCWAYLLVLIL